MRKHYYFIKGDIFRWLKVIPYAREIIKDYKYYWPQEMKADRIDEFKEANHIIQNYRTFMASLSDEEKHLIDNFYKHQGVIEQSNIYFNGNIIENWELIVLNDNRHKLEELNIPSFAKFIKSKREDAGFYRAEAAKYLKISPSTLKSYEEGTRCMPLNIWFKICQLYEIDNDDMSELSLK